MKKVCLIFLVSSDLLICSPNNMTLHQQITQSSVDRENAKGPMDFWFTFEYGTLMSALPLSIYFLLDAISQIKNKRAAGWVSFKPHFFSMLGTLWAGAASSTVRGVFNNLGGTSFGNYLWQATAAALPVWCFTILANLTFRYC